MKLYSTRNSGRFVDFKQAVFHSLPPDNGLYMPAAIATLSEGFINSIHQKTFKEIAFEVSKTLLAEEIEPDALHQIIEESINFSAPVKEIEKDIYVLELFHGPSMAFKDFGARFMSRVMSYFLKKEEREIDILVATSGDTGGAVALGFYDIPGIQVTILFPKDKVSSIQQKQLTTLKKNITAIEVEGTFDDCQQMVKSAFLDEELKCRMQLTSANSINIARLIPQTFYYFNTYAQIRKIEDEHDIVFSVPSGNFGNLTAGLIAAKMGLPVHRFVASTNINDEVPQYLNTGIFEPRPSAATLSNAMDVGNPSNFERMSTLFNDDVSKMREEISGYSYSDDQTIHHIKQVFRESNYILCPHTAIAYAGLREYMKEKNENCTGVFLSTAHPCKFPDAYSTEIWEQITEPEQVKALQNKEESAIQMKNEYSLFKEWLLKR